MRTYININESHAIRLAEAAALHLRIQLLPISIIQIQIRFGQYKSRMFAENVVMYVLKHAFLKPQMKINGARRYLTLDLDRRGRRNI